MSKYISRLSRKQKGLNVQLTEFQLNLSEIGQIKNIMQINLELQRGKTKKVLTFTEEITQKINFQGFFNHDSQFYLSKNEHSQTKNFDFKLIGFEKGKKPGQLGSKQDLGKCKIDLSKFLDKTNESIKLDLQKSKIGVSSLNFQLSIKSTNYSGQTKSVIIEQIKPDMSDQRSLSVSYGQCHHPIISSGKQQVRSCSQVVSQDYRLQKKNTLIFGMNQPDKAIAEISSDEESDQSDEFEDLLQILRQKEEKLREIRKNAEIEIQRKLEFLEIMKTYFPNKDLPEDPKHDILIKFQNIALKAQNNQLKKQLQKEEKQLKEIQEDINDNNQFLSETKVIFR